jgi:4,5-DOPA dioxygenase extradiol
VFPKAEIPVVELSIDETQAPDVHYRIGRSLQPLREEGILIIGSGNVVHNLQAYAWDGRPVDPFDWAVRFESKVRELLVQHQDEPLVAYESLGRDARLAVPTPDHYLPLLYVLGLRKESDELSFPVEGFDGGSVSMLAVQLG